MAFVVAERRMDRLPEHAKQLDENSNALSDPAERHGSSPAHRLIYVGGLPGMVTGWLAQRKRIGFLRQEDGGAAIRLCALNVETGHVASPTPDLRWVGSPSWRP